MSANENLFLYEEKKKSSNDLEIIDEEKYDDTRNSEMFDSILDNDFEFNPRNYRESIRESESKNVSLDIYKEVRDSMRHSPTSKNDQSKSVLFQDFKSIIEESSSSKNQSMM